MSTEELWDEDTDLYNIFPVSIENERLNIFYYLDYEKHDGYFKYSDYRQSF